MKKTLYIIASLIMAAAAICSCQRPVLVTGVTLDSKSHEMIIGDTFTLVATISPADADNTAVIWSSSNSSVANVSNGRVSAIAAGTAQISVKTDDGCFTDACTVTVYEKEILPTAIKIVGAETISLLESETANLAVSLTPDDVTNRTITWKTSDPGVAVVTDGVVTALKAGEAEIIATTCNGLEAKLAVTVSCNVSGVVLDYPTITLDEGQSQQLIAKVYPSRATNTEVTWKSEDPGVATVSDEGLVKGVKAGSTVVSVKTRDGDFSDECLVTVTSRVSSLELDKTEMVVFVGESGTLKATIKPANATNTEINWFSEDESVAKVSDTGEVTGVKAGKTRICATTVDGGKHAMCDVTVYNHVASISLDQTDVLLYVGGVSCDLIATVLPEDAPDRSVSWTSSNPKVATVDANGKVSPVSVGEATITATTADLGLTATCNVTVKKIVLVSSLTLDQTKARVEMGNTLQLTATISPDDATDRTVTWLSSDPSVAVVSDGLVTPKKTGNVTITVKANDASGKTATCEVSIVIPVTEVSFKQAEVSVDKGKTVTLEVNVLPEYATVKSLEWTSSDPTVAAVDADGTVTGKKDGTVTITARSLDSGVSAQCKVTVVTKVESISLSPETLSLKVGESGTLAATITPSDATDKSLTWTSSDTSVATVDGSGKVTAKKVGKTTITAAAKDGSGKKAAATVIVGIPVSEITLNQTSYTLGKGESYTLSATVKPDNATDKTITWKSSDSAVATVDANGAVKGIKDGEATITATNEISGVSASCKIKVITKVVSITLSPETLPLKVGESGTIAATITPSDATDKSLTWTSSDTSVATVDANGKVTAKKVGKTTITAAAKDGSGKKATATVSVGIPVSGISFNVSSKTISRGETYAIVATITPSNATDKTLNWESSDPTVATVASDGKVTGVKAGKTTITATNPDSGKSASCAITVVVRVEKITLSDTKLTLKKGESQKVTATVTPADADNPKLKWSSKNEAVATVGQDGTITAVAEGNAIIRVEATDGSGEYATVSVTVSPDIVPVEKIELDPTSLKLKIGQSATIKATVYPIDKRTAPLKWMSSNGNIASVDDNGVVTAVSEGRVRIRAVATDDSGKYAECSVEVPALVKVNDITLSKTSETLAIGGTLALTATVAPDDADDKSIVWSSDKATVASVDQNGLVTAKDVGTATISATSKDGSNISATCTITVVSKFVPVTGIDWVGNPPEVLYVGDQQSYASYVKISPTNATNKNIIWQVQQGSVLTLKDGIYTANKVGQCNVTAKTEDGEYTCSLTVTVKSVPVSSVSISKESLSLKVGASQQLSATVYPSNATNKNVTWKSSNPGVATVTSGTGLVKAVSKGTAVITVTTADGSKKDTCSVTVYSDPTGGESEGIDFEDL